MPTSSFSFQRSSVSITWCRSKRLRSRRSATPIWSRWCDKNFWAIKNPASNAGLIRLPPGPRCARRLRRMCSKLDFFLSGIRNQLHLWISRQVRFVSRLPLESGHHQHQESIPEKSFSSSMIGKSFLIPPVDFRGHCGNSGTPFGWRSGRPEFLLATGTFYQRSKINGVVFHQVNFGFPRAIYFRVRGGKSRIPIGD